MKVIHGSLKNLLQEAKDKKVDAVRVAGFMQSDVVANAQPCELRLVRLGVSMSSGRDTVVMGAGRGWRRPTFRRSTGASAGALRCRRSSGESSGWRRSTCPF